MLNITSEDTYNFFRIKFNGITQLSIKKREVVSFQSWRFGDHYFAMEFKTATNVSSIYEYDSKEKWEAIIKELEKHEII